VPSSVSRRLETDADFGDEPWHRNRGLMPSTRHLELDWTEIAAAAAFVRPP